MPTNTTASYVKTLCLTAIVLVLYGCAAGDGARVYEKDGRRYGETSGAFRHRWWNYYERAVSYNEGGYWADAVSDIEAALRQRDADGRRARTYGMHFADYFPHRELGIAYLGLGRPEDAARELELSLSQEGSAKAKFYLNKARKAVMEKAGAGPDAPSIALDCPDSQAVNTLTFRLTGRAKAAGLVSSLRIDGRPELIELAEEEVGFAREVALAEGDNLVTITAKDLLGREAHRELRILADTSGPVLAILPTDGVSGALLKCEAYDRSGVSGVRLNGRPLDITPGESAAFTVPAGASGEAPLVIEADDGLGNTTTASVEPSELAAAGAGMDALVPGGGALYASLDGAIFAAAPGRADMPPSIGMRGPSDGQVVYCDSLLVEGKVTGSTEIRRITVGGEALSSRGGVQVFFNHLVRLKPGENQVVITAQDASGARSEKTLTVVRKQQKARSIEGRLSVSAVPFRQDGQGGLAGLPYDAFLGAMAEQRRFRMVERALLEEVLTEQALSREEIADPATAARLGRVLAAECVIVGDCYQTDKSIEVFARLVDTETAEIIAALDVYGEDTGPGGITELMEGLAVKLKGEFPLVEGMVIKHDGEELMLDIGASAGVKNNTFITLFREGEPVIHPVTGKSLGAPTELVGKAKLYEVYDEMSRARLVAVEKGRELKPTDLAITR